MPGSSFGYMYGVPKRESHDRKHFGIPMYGAPARPDPPHLVPHLPADPPQNPTIMWQLEEILIRLEKILGILEKNS